MSDALKDAGFEEDLPKALAKAIEGQGKSWSREGIVELLNSIADVVSTIKVSIDKTEATKDRYWSHTLAYLDSRASLYDGIVDKLTNKLENANREVISLDSTEDDNVILNNNYERAKQAVTKAFCTVTQSISFFKGNTDITYIESELTETKRIFDDNPINTLTDDEVTTIRTHILNAHTRFSEIASFFPEEFYDEYDGELTDYKSKYSMAVSTDREKGHHWGIFILDYFELALRLPIWKYWAGNAAPNSALLNYLMNLAVQGNNYDTNYSTVRYSYGEESINNQGVAFVGVEISGSKIARMEWNGNTIVKGEISGGSIGIRYSNVIKKFQIGETIEVNRIYCHKDNHGLLNKESLTGITVKNVSVIRVKLEGNVIKAESITCGIIDAGSSAHLSS